MGKWHPGDFRSAFAAGFVQVHQGLWHQGWLECHLQNAGS